MGEHLQLHVGLAGERRSRVLLLLRDRGRVEVRRGGSRTVARVATHRRLRHVAHLRGRVGRRGRVAHRRGRVGRRGRVRRRGRVGSADGAHGNKLAATANQSKARAQCKHMQTCTHRVKQELPTPLRFWSGCGADAAPARHAEITRLDAVDSDRS